MNFQRPLLVIVSSAFQHILITQPNTPKLTSKDKVHSRVSALEYILILQGFCIWGVAAGESITHILLLYTSYKGVPGSSHTLFSPYNGTGSEEFGAITIPFVIGIVLSMFTGWLRKESYRTLGHLYTFHHTTRRNHALITSGPYAYVRHPGYASLIPYPFVSVLVALGKGSWLKECGIFENYAIVKYTYSAYVLLNAIVAVGVMIRAGKEDRTLQEKFGKDWEAYAERVPYRFIPYLI